MAPKLITSIYSRAAGALLLAFLVVLVLASSMPPAMALQGENGVIAKYFDEYTAGDPSVNWELRSKDCKELDGDTPLAWRQRYKWTDFCGEVARRTGNHVCEQCLQVTNPATTASVTVRIVDICSKINGDDAALGMDKDAFNEIDTDDQGKNNGQLMVNYEFVECALDQDDD